MVEDDLKQLFSFSSRVILVMKRKQLCGGSSQEVSEEGGSATYDLSRMLKLGDFVWTKLDDSLWWPAQVVDANSVSATIKPSNRSVGEVLVRVYGSYTYLYMDPTKCRDEFEHVLEQNNGRHSAVFLKSLEQVSSPSESGCSKGRGHKNKGKGRSEAAKGELKNDLTGKKQEERSSRSIPVSPRIRPAAECPNEAKKNGFLHQETISAMVSEELSARRKKVMQSLGLVPPSGSPFNKSVQR